MDPSAIPIFMAGPFPVLYTSSFDELEADVQLDIALLIGGLPTILASTVVPFDDTWIQVEEALESGDARLGVAGIPHESESVIGTTEVYPSAYVGLECANGERIVLAHIRSPEPDGDPEAYARSVIKGILQGRVPGELGELIEE